VAAPTRLAAVAETWHAALKSNPGAVGDG
jgi:hypothetical protein